MRTALRVIIMVVGFPIAFAHAEGVPRIADLPPPVREYAEALKPYCEAIGKQAVSDDSAPYRTRRRRLVLGLLIVPLS